MKATDHLRHANINKKSLKWSTYVDIFHSIDDASFFDPFNESVAGPVIRDGQSEGIFTLGDFNLLWSSYYHKKVVSIRPCFGHVFFIPFL